MKIQILGTGCPKCKQLTANAEAAVAALGIEATIEKVQKIAERWNEENPEEEVTVHELAVFVHREATVRVAVKGDAEIVAAGDDHARERLDVGRAAVGVDVAAVRVVLDKLEVDWKAAENAQLRHSAIHDSGRLEGLQENTDSGTLACPARRREDLFPRLWNLP